MPAMIYQNGAWKEAETPKAYSGGAFVDTEGKVYQNGAWVDAWGGAYVLFENGNTIKGYGIQDKIYNYKYSGSSSWVSGKLTMICTPLIDLSKFNYLCANIVEKSYDAQVFISSVDMTNSGSVLYKDENWYNYVLGSNNKYDISNFNGRYSVGIGINVGAGNDALPYIYDISGNVLTIGYQLSNPRYIKTNKVWLE